MMEVLSAPPDPSQQTGYYRELAGAIRARLPTLQDEEAISELYLLASHCERLVEFADSLGPFSGVAWPDNRTRRL